MKVYSNDEVDTLYIKLGDEPPYGVVEISEGINVDLPSDDRVVGIEILHASKKIKTLLSYNLEFDKELITQRIA